MKRWLAVCGWMLVILYLSTKKVTADYGAIAPALVHFVEYGILAVLVRSASARSLRSGIIALDILGVAWASTYGALMEIAQYFLPARTADLQDAAVNFLGALVGVGAAHMLAEGRKTGR